MSEPIRIATPCSVSWSSMTPTTGGRHCASCDKVVVDISSMTRERAESVVAQGRGLVCVNGLFDHARGEFVHARPKRRLALLANLAAGAAIALSAEQALAQDARAQRAHALVVSQGAPQDEAEPRTARGQRRTRRGPRPVPTPAPSERFERLGGAPPMPLPTPPPRKRGKP